MLKKTSDFKKEQGIKYLLHRDLSQKEEPRDLEILHASELTKEDVEFCPRERSLLIRDGDNRPDEFLGTALAVTFAVGRFYEHEIRNNWLRKYALGDWQCQSCGDLYQYQTVPPHCDGCGALEEQFVYQEPRAYSPEYDTSCGIDLLLWRKERLHVVEIKSMKGEDFNKLQAPLSEHRRRTQFYLDLLSHSTWMDFDVDINLDFAYLLYVSKGFGVKDDYEGRAGITDSYFSPFKEFKVKRGDGKGLKPVYDKALAVKKFKETGKLPKRICPSIGCKRAKRCSVRAACFAEAT